MTDTCPDVSNPDQLVSDFDGLGDACDLDLDGDSLDNDADNCRGATNADQLDLDGDGVGDACDEDADGDGVDADEDYGDLDPLIPRPETCFDATDSDCDGLVDPEDPDAIGSATLYRDAGSDGYGDPTRPLEGACDALEGYALEAAECESPGPSSWTAHSKASSPSEQP